MNYFSTENLAFEKKIKNLPMISNFVMVPTLLSKKDC